VEQRYRRTIRQIESLSPKETDARKYQATALPLLWLRESVQIDESFRERCGIPACRAEGVLMDFRLRMARTRRSVNVTAG